jgi:protease YdgD
VVAAYVACPIPGVRDVRPAAIRSPWEENMKTGCANFHLLGCFIILIAVTPDTGTAESWPDKGIASPGRLNEAPLASGDSAAHIADSDLSKYAAVGRFTGTMTCTAAMVLHPRIIVTAGHCIAARKHALRPPSFFFQPGYQTGTDLGRYEAIVWAIGSRHRVKRQSTHDASNDWAVLVLDRAPAGVRPFGLGQYTADQLVSLRRQLLLPSYALDATGTLRLSVDPACSVHDLAWDVLVHDCRASLGSSGAPLMIAEQRSYAVVGIHSGSMFASEQEGHVAKLIGNSAIGTWAFADALQALVGRLNSGADIKQVGFHGY